MRGRNVAAGAAAVTLVSMLAGCAPYEGGPLVGGRGGEYQGSPMICALAPAPGATVYFGSMLTNEGDSAITLTEVRGSGTNVASIDAGIDLEGVALDQAVGSMSWPADDSWEGAEEVLDRLVAPEDAVIEPGTTAQVIFSIVPVDPEQPATVEDLEVLYDNGIISQVERDTLGYRIMPGDSCEVDEDEDL
ncbi:hypothetical protein [Demequina gelatinilytica]|uniref:hypothetical protein n=1 Tax=Demequina gelatinilytica TaxID=1638980 RepID=UPI0007859117|nr:hypothetical protein [Demequina gelatinilytica]